LVPSAGWVIGCLTWFLTTRFNIYEAEAKDFISYLFIGTFFSAIYAANFEYSIDE